MIPGLVVLSAIALALAHWGHWLSTKPRVPMNAARFLRWSFLLLTPVPAIGIALTYFGLQHAFQAIDGADPANKARLLAEGISEAMNGAAFAVIVLFIETTILFTGRGSRITRAARPKPARIRRHAMRCGNACWAATAIRRAGTTAPRATRPA